MVSHGLPIPVPCTLPCKQAVEGAGCCPRAPGHPLGKRICLLSHAAGQLLGNSRAQGLRSSPLLENGLRRRERRDREPCKWMYRLMAQVSLGKGKACSFVGMPRYTVGSGKSFPFPPRAELRAHCSPRAGQSQPPPAGPDSEQTGEGASFMAGTRSQTECCVISHIL